MLFVALHSLLVIALPAPVAAAQKPTDVRLDVGSPPGQTNSLRQVIAASGSAVYVAWQDHRGPTGDVYFNRSLDGGATWLPSDVQVDVGPLPGYSLVPAIAASGGSVYVTWQDTRNLKDDIYFNRSLDGGSTWLPADVRLDVGTAAGAAHSWIPVIAASGASVYVAWEDTRNSSDSGPLDIYFNRSLDGGSTWLPADVRLDTGSVVGSSSSIETQLAVSGSSVYAVWTDRRAGNGGIYLNRSLDGGETWMPSDVRLDTESAPDAVSSSSPVIAASGAAVYVAWVDAWPGSPGVIIGNRLYFNRSLDGGTTWLPTAVRIDSGDLFRGPKLAVSGSSVYLAWGGQSHPGWNVFFNRSLDAGTSWLPADVQLSADVTTSGKSGFPTIATAGSSVYVVWESPFNTGNGNADVYFDRSLDSGSTWLATDVRLDLGSAPLSGNSIEPGIAASGSSVYVAWEDRRNSSTFGPGDIYFNLPLGYQTYGQGAAGSGGLVPALLGSGVASVGGTASVDISNGRGGAPCTLLYSFAGPASIPLSFGKLLLQPPLLSIGVSLGGTPGAPGAGSASVLGTIPNDLGLIGLRINFQAGVFDPAALRAVALTKGLELWIL